MKLQFSRSIAIQKPASEIFAVLSDLKNWNSWSPWVHCEPTARTELTGARGPGQTQTWSGEVIGAGKMTVEKLDEGRAMEMRLEFFAPWKSVARIEFELRPAGAGTEVTWRMDSQLPIFMFFFKNMMIAYMSSDFDRGLRMLKELVETGAVASRSVYRGEREFGKFHVVGRRFSCAIAEISAQVRPRYEELDRLHREGKLPTPDFMVTLSHRHDIPKGVCEMTAGYAYRGEVPRDLPAGLEVFEVGGHKALAVDHYGPYRHIGNGWSMAVTYQRGKKKKISKKVPSYEVYKTMPGAGPEKDIHTEIVVPLRS